MSREPDSLDTTGGKFWMWVWVAVFGVSLVWGLLTVIIPSWRESVFNVAMLSVFAIVLSAAGGVQTTLTMRKADPKDDF